MSDIECRGAGDDESDKRVPAKSDRVLLDESASQAEVYLPLTGAWHSLSFMLLMELYLSMARACTTLKGR